MNAAEFDYVVVGAGSSGAALAARLGEASDRTTCVIEAGGPDTHPFIHIPSFVAAAIGREATNWRFKTVPQPGMAGREIPVPRGRVLGGSGAINGMVYFRGHPTDYDDWVATDPLSTARVKKVEAGKVSYVSITTTATGTYSTDAMFSNHVQYPGISVTPAEPDRNVFRYWTNGRWSAFSTGTAGSFTYYGLSR